MIDITAFTNKNNRQYENWIKRPMPAWGVYPMLKKGGGDRVKAPFYIHTLEVNSEQLARQFSPLQRTINKI
jgi:hypothetical protein